MSPSRTDIIDARGVRVTAPRLTPEELARATKDALEATAWPMFDRERSMLVLFARAVLDMRDERDRLAAEIDEHAAAIDRVDSLTAERDAAVDLAAKEREYRVACDAYTIADKSGAYDAMSAAWFARAEAKQRLLAAGGVP